MSILNYELDFHSLTELHESANNMLHSPEFNFGIINNNNEEHLHQVSEASLKMADSCASTKDLLLLAKDHLQTLQSAFRHISSPDIKMNFAPFRLPRKHLKKTIMKQVDSLKGFMNTAFMLENESLLVVVNMLKEVKCTILLIVTSILSLIALPNSYRKASPTRKDQIFRLRLTRVDSFSFWEKCGTSDVRAAMRRLEDAEVVLENMEDELERMFRRLIKTRASLLNLLTQ